MFTVSKGEVPLNKSAETSRLPYITELQKGAGVTIKKGAEL